MSTTANQASWSTPNTHPFAVNMPAGTSLVGLPATPTGHDPAETLTTPRLVRWNSSTQSYERLGPTTFDLAPGIGYWVMYTKPTTVSFTGVPVSVPMTVSMHSGWNLLANPVATDLSWGNLSASGSILHGGWIWDGTGYRLVSDLAGLDALPAVPAWHGFWVFANEDCDSPLAFPLHPEWPLPGLRLERPAGPFACALRPAEP